jgi:hypothetical protein
MAVLFCYASGEMGISKTKALPDGTLIILHGAHTKCQDAMMLGEQTAERDRANRAVWRVPGVKGAAGEAAKLEALSNFSKVLFKKGVKL